MSDNKKEIMLVDEKALRNKIYVLRGQQVMLDFDLAEIYGYTVSAFNQQVKRNADRFPEDFLFELTSTEMKELSKSQNVISIQVTGVKGGRSKPVKAFGYAGYRTKQNTDSSFQVYEGLLDRKPASPYTEGLLCVG